MQFKNLSNKLKYLYFQNNIYILFQIFISFFYLKTNNFFALYIYVLMIEFIWNDTNKNFLNYRYCYFIFFKNIILILVMFLENNLFILIILYILTIRQFLFICKIYFQQLKQIKIPFCIDKDNFLKERVLFKRFIDNWFYIFIITNFFVLYYLNSSIIIPTIISVLLIFIFKEYKFLFYFIIFTLFLSLSVNIGTTTYKDYSISIFSTITNFAILNIATFFIILQLNYQKFNSTFILWNIIKSSASIFTFFPSFILLFSFVFIDEKSKVLIFGFDTYRLLIFLQIFSILSLLGLLFYTKYFLETNFLLKQIFRNMRIYDDNDKYILNDEETSLEVILNLIQNTIIKKDYNTAYSLFFNFACWTKLYIDQLKFKSILYKDIEKNKFSSIFETIMMILDKENDIVLQKYFIEAFDKIIFVNINNDNFYKFKIIIDKFKKQLLNNLEKKNDEIAIKIYYMMYRNTDKILIKLQKINNCNYLFHQDNLVKQFMNIYVEQNYNIIHIAIKNKNIRFLKTFNIIHSLFDIEHRNQWDGKQLDILISERSNLLKQYKFLIEQKERVDFDYFEYLLPCNYFDNSKIVCQKEFLDYVIDILISIYLYTIEQKHIEYGDFGIIRIKMSYCIENKNNEYFELFFKLYIFLIYKICKQDDDQMNNLFKSLISDITERYLSHNFNNEFIHKETKKMLKKCNLSDNYFEEIIIERKKSFNNFKLLSETNWSEILDLDKIKEKSSNRVL